MQWSRARIDDSSLSTRILRTLAEEIGCSPLDFDRPLYDAVDPDALDALFDGDRRSGSIEFTYLGYRIQASGDGDIAVRMDG